MNQHVPQPHLWVESTVCATFGDHPPTPHWRLAAKLMTLTNTLPTPLQVVLDTELYKADALLNWSKSEQMMKWWTLRGICTRMAYWRHWDPPCALEGCTRQRQYPDGFAWDRCCKECFTTDGHAHDRVCDEEFLFDELARATSGRAPQAGKRKRICVPAVRGG